MHRKIFFVTITIDYAFTGNIIQISLTVINAKVSPDGGAIAPTPIVQTKCSQSTPLIHNCPSTTVALFISGLKRPEIKESRDCTKLGNRLTFF